MKRTEAACPACGAPVEFRVSSSLVAVCGQCGSLAARGDRKLEDQGKVAALVATSSPLALGVTGVYEGKSFELVGRAQYRHASGAVWDEWYAAFSNGKWGWLAEAQGRFFLTFPRSLAADSSLLPHGELRPAMSVQLGSLGSFTVADLGPSQRIAVAGELPYVPTIGSPHRFADLSGPNGAFASLDYDGPQPQLFAGRQVTLADLAISALVEEHEQVVEVSAILIDCPHCGGSLETHAPDQIERIVCPYCRSMLDADHGKLRYMRTLSWSDARPLIPIGKTGTLRGVSYTVIGFMQRSVMIAGTNYYWTEYLLYGADQSFRWLVNSDGHWSFVEPVAPGDVQTSGNQATHRGRKYKLFQRARAKVEYVLGEFTWKVEVGEQVMASDYVAPPWGLSIEVTQPRESWADPFEYLENRERLETPIGESSESSESSNAESTSSAAEDFDEAERGDDGEYRLAPAPAPAVDEAASASDGGGASEVNMSLANYLSHDELEAAFGLQRLPRGFVVAPFQPNPVDKSVYWMWVGFAALLLLIQLVASVVRGPGKVDISWLVICGVLITIVPFGALIYSGNFEQRRWEESMFGGGDDD